MRVHSKCGFCIKIIAQFSILPASCVWNTRHDYRTTDSLLHKLCLPLQMRFGFGGTACPASSFHPKPPKRTEMPYSRLERRERWESTQALRFVVSMTTAPSNERCYFVVVIINLYISEVFWCSVWPTSKSTHHFSVSCTRTHHAHSQT